MINPTSIECQASMTPSTVLAPIEPTRERGVCGMCHGTYDLSKEIHPVCGRLCVWCAMAADYDLDRHGAPVRPSDHCPHCQDGDCDLHESSVS